MESFTKCLTRNSRRCNSFQRSSNPALRKLEWIIFIGPLMMVSSLVLAAPLPSLGAVEIMEKSVEVLRFKDTIAKATLTLTGRDSNMRVRKTSGYTRLRPNGTDNMRLVRFLAPADIRGTATLMIENSRGDDDMWIFLPALSKVRRLSASDKSGAFVGTDFSYGDIIGHKTSDWIHQLVNEVVVEGAPCYLINSLPANDTVKANSGYSRRETCVQKDNFIAVRTDFWDTEGQPLKRIQVSNFKQVGSAGHWQPLLWVAENLQTGHKTTIEFDEFKADSNVSEKLFTPQELNK